MKNLNEYPTPQTDSAWHRIAATTFDRGLRVCETSRDLEQKLAACREGFSDLLDAVLHGDFSNGEWNTIEIEDAQKTLAVTAP